MQVKCPTGCNRDALIQNSAREVRVSAVLPGYLDQKLQALARDRFQCAITGKPDAFCLLNGTITSTDPKVDTTVTEGIHIISPLINMNIMDVNFIFLYKGTLNHGNCSG
jgi:hypothetical protein